MSAGYVAAERTVPPYVAERYPLFDNFYDQNEPDLVASLFGAHHADRVHDGEVLGQGGTASSPGGARGGHGEASGGHGGGHGNGHGRH